MTDDARITAFDPAAPASEVYDANAELGKAYRPLASQLIPAEDLRPVIDHIRGQWEEQEMMKAAGGQIIQFPDQRGGKPPPSRGMQSVYLDDLQIFANGEYYEKPTPLGFEGLRQVVERTPILASVVMTRIRQVSRFTQISEDGGPGFEIRHADRKHKLTGAEQEAAQLLGRFFQNCGWEFNPRKRKMLRRDNFAQFISKSIRDSLSMDASPIETEMKRNRSLGLDGFYAVDGSTIRLCHEEGYQGDDSIYAVQVVQGRLTTAYNLDQLIYEVRNPRADVRLAGYGLGEPELMIQVVTGFLNALTYNIKGFDENAIPKGLLHLSGQYSSEDLSAFKRYWNAMVKGINNAWTLPVMVSSDQESKATFEKFGVEFNEMYFSRWMTFLTSIVTAIYGMDPTEINFESFSEGKSSLSGNDTSEKLANSKDKGLRPLMAFYEATLTDFVVAEFDPNFCFRWVGVDEEDQQQAWEGKKLTLRIDELRAEQGYERWSAGDPTGPDMGAAPLNPSLIGPWMQMQQGGQDFGGQPGAAEQGDFGQPPAEGQGGGDKPGQSDDDASGDKPAPGAGGSDFGGQKSGGGDFGKALNVYSIEG